MVWSWIPGIRVWTSLGGCSYILTTSLFSLHAARSPLLDGSLEAKKSNWFATLLEQSYPLSSISVCAPTALDVTSDCFCFGSSRLPLPSPLPATLTFSWFLLSSALLFLLLLYSSEVCFFIASANLWEHSPDLWTDCDSFLSVSF